MALITCPECGRRAVSDTAASCPDCSADIQKLLARSTWAGRIQADLDSAASSLWNLGKQLTSAVFWSALAFLLLGAIAAQNETPLGLREQNEVAPAARVEPRVVRVNAQEESRPRLSFPEIPKPKLHEVELSADGDVESLNLTFLLGGTMSQVDAVPLPFKKKFKVDSFSMVSLSAVHTGERGSFKLTLKVDGVVKEQAIGRGAFAVANVSTMVDQ